MWAVQRAALSDTMAKVFVIAEAGVNHNGSIDFALQLIEAAKASGADAVKFQSFRAEQLATQSAHKAAYQERTTERSESQFEMLKRLELDAGGHQRLSKHCKNLGIAFLSSPFDCQSVDLLDAIGVPLFKVPSGEITNFPFLQHVASKGKPIILSTGMSTLGEVEEAIEVIRKAGTTDLTLLHCVTEYPAPYEEINLRAMETMRRAFNLPVGYSDHSPGIEIAIAATAMGAEVIEKHFTLDRSLPGPDHAASLEPSELKEMIGAIRHVEAALGNGVKVPTPCEVGNMAVARKSIVAAMNLPAGRKLQATDLLIKRPGNGLAPKYLSMVCGRTLRVAVSQDALLQWDHFA
jgi:N,N'-diacetyllegionaminate synthase